VRLAACGRYFDRKGRGLWQRLSAASRCRRLCRKWQGHRFTFRHNLQVKFEQEPQADRIAGEWRRLPIAPVDRAIENAVRVNEFARRCVRIQIGE